jgi:hypothetical protein
MGRERHHQCPGDKHPDGQPPRSDPVASSEPHVPAGEGRQDDQADPECQGYRLIERLLSCLAGAQWCPRQLRRRGPRRQESEEGEPAGPCGGLHPDPLPTVDAFPRLAKVRRVVGPPLRRDVGELVGIPEPRRVEQRRPVHAGGRLRVSVDRGNNAQCHQTTAQIELDVYESPAAAADRRQTRDPGNRSGPTEPDSGDSRRGRARACSRPARPGSHLAACD